MEDLLLYILVTAPVFHAEMSELKAEADSNTTNKSRTTIVKEGGGEEFNKYGVNNNNSSSNSNNNNNKTYCFSYWLRPPCSMPKCPN